MFLMSCLSGYSQFDSPYYKRLKGDTLWLFKSGDKIFKLEIRNDTLFINNGYGVFGGGGSWSTDSIGSGFPGFGTSHSVAAYGDHTHSGVYEPKLGNPGTTGFVLSSTTAGARSWVAQSGGIPIDSIPFIHNTPRHSTYFRNSTDRLIIGGKTSWCDYRNDPNIRLSVEGSMSLQDTLLFPSGAWITDFGEKLGTNYGWSMYNLILRSPIREDTSNYILGWNSGTKEVKAMHIPLQNKVNIINNSFTGIYVLTQAQYNAIPVKDTMILYFIR